MSSLEGKVALVTGAARGIGAACATSLAKRNAHVVLTDVLDSVGEATAADLRAQGYNATFRTLDATDEQAWDRVVASVVAEFGHLDILVNNAGITLAKTIED